MRHRVYGKHLGRNKDQRRALFKGLVHALLSHGTIQISEAKAKAIKGLIDKIINSAKKNPKATPENLQELIDRLIPKLGTRTSGYTKIVRTGTRLGDQTMMVKMSLIGAEELKPVEKGSRVQGLGVSKKPVQIKEKKEKKSTRKNASRSSKTK